MPNDKHDHVSFEFEVKYRLINLLLIYTGVKKQEAPQQGEYSSIHTSKENLRLKIKWINLLLQSLFLIYFSKKNTDFYMRDKRHAKKWHRKSQFFM